MKKILWTILLFALLLGCFTGCRKEEPALPAVPEGELDGEHPLIKKLVFYLEWSMIGCDKFPRRLESQINDIKNGTQALHVSFRPSDRYYICGYYNSATGNGDTDDPNCHEYIWVGYRKEDEIPEFYRDAECAVVFQINRASTVEDIMQKGRAVPNVEHFQIYRPTFENGVNTASSIEFSDTLIYITYPQFPPETSQKSDTVYYHTDEYTKEIIPCVYLDGEYALSFYLYTVLEDGTHSEDADYSFRFGEYYDTLTHMIERDKYRITNESGRTDVYGTVSMKKFISDILK